MITITIPATVDVASVVSARNGFVDSLTSSYGSGRTYAATLVAFFRHEGHGDDWMTMEHDAKGPAGDAMRGERDALYAGLKKAGHSNPSVKWKQIKGYAIDLIRAESGEDADGETDGDGESEGTGKKTVRSHQLRLIEDLTTLHKACVRESKTATEQQKNAATFIASALGALGVDISTL